MIYQGVCFVKNKLVVVLVLLAFFLCAPAFLSNYWLFILAEVFIMALYATSFNLLLGSTGLLSFGHGAYFAVGAYATALVLKSTSAPLFISLAAGVMAAFVFAAVFGFLCVRLTEIYFAMLTLSFSQLVYFIAFQWRDVTGGDDGLPGIIRPPIDIFGTSIDLNNPMNFYFFCLGVVALSLWILRRIVNSPLGYMFQAIRDNSIRGEFTGIPVNRYRLISFVIAGIFGGLSGSVYALWAGFVSPEIAHFGKSGEAVFMTLIGGIHTFFGPSVGAAIYTFLHTYIASKTEHWLLYFGIILLVIVLMLPEGVLGRIKRIRVKP
jgi:branched-chain amino acid transport system permease protein